jgi:hypothetical protein
MVKSLMTVPLSDPEPFGMPRPEPVPTELADVDSLIDVGG